MEKCRVVDEKFKQLEESSDCEKINQITGVKCSFLEKDEILRFFIDDNLDSSISNVKYNKTCLFNYIDKSDLIIIGFCLDGKRQ